MDRIPTEEKIHKQSGYQEKSKQFAKKPWNKSVVIVIVCSIITVASFLLVEIKRNYKADEPKSDISNTIQTIPPENKNEEITGDNINDEPQNNLLETIPTTPSSPNTEKPIDLNNSNNANPTPSEPIIVPETSATDSSNQSIIVVFDANGGSVPVASKTVYEGKAIGDLPTPSRTNLTFLGWFKEDGTRVTKDTVFSATSLIIIKAHWQSGWVVASELPYDGDVNNTKWTYDLTTRTTSNSSTAPVGYTSYKDPTWVWGSFGSWSGWSKTEATASDSRKVETKTVTDREAYTNYKYYIYRTGDGWGYGTYNYYVPSYGYCTLYDEINLNYALPLHSASLETYGPYNSGMFPHSGDSFWFDGGASYVPAVTHIEYRYADRSKVYTYYYQKVETKESTSVVSDSDSISNVTKWLQYTVK